MLLSCTLQKRLQNKLQKRLQKINKSQHHTFHQEYTSEVFALQLQKTFVTLNISHVIIDNLQFQWAFEMTQSSITLLHRIKLTISLKNWATIVQVNILKNLSTNSKIFISLDEWTSSNRLSFLVIMRFYYIEFWKYRKVLLSFEQIEDKHIDSNLSSITEWILQELDIQDRVMTIIMNNVSNNDVMMMTLNETLQTFSATSHLSCLAHVIQLAVKQLLKLLMLSSKNENEKKYWILKISLQSMSVQESLSRTLFKIINNFYLSCYFTLQLFLQSILQSILQSLSEIQSKLLFMTL